MCPFRQGFDSFRQKSLVRVNLKRGSHVKEDKNYRIPLGSSTYLVQYDDHHLLCDAVECVGAYITMLGET
jgi:hypothetical protein